MICYFQQLNKKCSIYSLNTIFTFLLRINMHATRQQKPMNKGIFQKKNECVLNNFGHLLLINFCIRGKNTFVNWDQGCEFKIKRKFYSSLRENLFLQIHMRERQWNISEQKEKPQAKKYVQTSKGSCIFRIFPKGEYCSEKKGRKFILILQLWGKGNYLIKF